MNGDPHTPHKPSSSEAKRNLLQSGQAADQAIAAQVNSTLAAVRKALPWIGGIAAVAGFFLARRRKRPGAESAAPRAGAAHSRSMPSFLGLAMQLAPIALKLLLRPRARNDEM